MSKHLLTGSKIYEVTNGIGKMSIPHSICNNVDLMVKVICTEYKIPLVVHHLNLYKDVFNRKQYMGQKMILIK